MSTLSQQNANNSIIEDITFKLDNQMKRIDKVFGILERVANENVKEGPIKG